MIESILNFFPTQGEELPAPTIKKLRNEYLLAANIQAKSKDKTNPHPDCYRVITLRPDVIPNCIAATIDHLTTRGYFAYGREENSEIIFEIYSPHSSVKSKFPPKSLETAVALFTLKLLNNGYSLNANSVNFVTQI